MRYKHCKLIYWLIWGCGFLLIGFVTTTINIGYILWEATVSSLPYLGLAIYTKKVLENEKINTHYKNVKLSGVAGAFIFVSIYATWAFHTSPANEALSPATCFIPISLPILMFGFIIGGLLYAVIIKIRKRG